MLTLAIVAVATGADYGVSWDYEAHNTYGKQIWDWYQRPSSDHIAVTHGMKYYGPAFEILVNIQRAIFGGDDVAVKSITTFFVGLAGAWGCFIAASAIAGSRAGFIAALLLMLTPMYYGHSFINHKDLPFASSYVLALAAIICSVKKEGNLSFSSIFWVGLAVGLSFGVRIGGIFLIPLLAVAWLYPALIDNSSKANLKISVNLNRAARNSFCILGALVIAWIIMAMLWPFILLNPITGPLEVFNRSSDFPWSHPVLFEGKHISAKALPISYMFVWFYRTLPEILIFCLGLGVLLLPPLLLRGKQFLLSKDAISIFIVLLSVILPLSAILILKSTLYDAVRHVLFVVPSLAIIAAISFDKFLKILPKLFSICIALVGIGGSLIIVPELITLHPYQYVYFNRLFGGGLSSAYGNFETEYWATCMKESLEWVDKNIPRSETPIKIAAWCDPLQITTYIDKMKEHRPDIVFTSVEAEANLYLTSSRFGAHLVRPYKLLHKISRQDVPLCFIFERNDPPVTPEVQP